MMQSFEVGYFECMQCVSLQTETPYWLEGAYAKNSILDVGRAQRNLITAMICAYMFSKLEIGGNERCLDWGGAEGLFCRFMRDRGFNFHTYDKYAESLYSAPYAITNPVNFAPTILTAFEVLEHLPNPADDLTSIFASRPAFLLCSTELYQQQSEDWMYLSPMTGRHVFFYSSSAMEWIANTFGYRYSQLPFVHAFVANSVWDDQHLVNVRHRWETLLHKQSSLFRDAAQSLLEHLTGDAWTHIGADYLEIANSLTMSQRI